MPQHDTPFGGNSVDCRTRADVPVMEVGPAEFVERTLPELLAANGAAAGSAAERLGLPPLTLAVAGEPLTLTPGRGRLTADLAASDALVIELDAAAFSDLVNDASSAFGLLFSGRVNVSRGEHDSFTEWEPVLRCLLDGRAVYEPGTIDFRDREGDPLDVRRSFRLDDESADMAHFLAEAGYLHVRGMFTEDEMAAVSAELDAAVAAAEPDDGASWWARNEAGERYPARILGFNRQSPTLRALVQDARFLRIGALTGDDFALRDPDTTDSAEGLVKKVGVVEGISDVSWHKDCSLGGHSRHCCGLVVGISVTGAGRENGELGVVPGSNRANIAPLGVAGLDLERVPVPTGTGDITVHCSCTLHMSRPPVSAERRVVYTGFNLLPRTGDQQPARASEAWRQQRAKMNEHVRRHQLTGTTTARSTSFEL